MFLQVLFALSARIFYFFYSKTLLDITIGTRNTSVKTAIIPAFIVYKLEGQTELKLYLRRHLVKDALYLISNQIATLKFYEATI